MSNDSSSSPRYVQLPLFPTKVCTKCRVEYPLTTEYWQKCFTRKGRLKSRCKTCCNASTRQWKMENPEKVKVNRKRHYQVNQEKAIETSRRWRENNHDRYIEANRRWRQENPEKARAKYKRHNARRKGADGSHTAKQTRTLYEQQQGRCFHCGTDISTGYHEDHWIPLSKGGSNYIENIRLLCPFCNLSKWNKLPHEWHPEKYPPPD
jgi:5-methylcytosine-specific restriction endonuclease McrA